MAKKLRLLLFSECNRHCAGCCNNDWDLQKLEVETNFRGYEAIFLTGGEPMLKPLLVWWTINQIRKQTTRVPIYLYTADVTNLSASLCVVSLLDGITITLHEQSDIVPFEIFNSKMQEYARDKECFSARLNVFSGVDITGVNTSGWMVKDKITWIANCPLPEGEVFKRALLPRE